MSSSILGFDLGFGIDFLGFGKANLALKYQNQTIDVATKILKRIIERIKNIRNSGFENSFNEV